MKKILVVEDDALLNKTLSYNLTTAGFEVVSALSVSAAQKSLENGQYDLIVLDVNLPDGNGFTLCKEIKAENNDVVIMFLTANDMESDMIKGFELGADDYVTKPFHISVFLKKVNAMLSRIEKHSENDIFTDGILTIDFSAAAATLSGKPLVFTLTEYKTLKMFVKNPNIVLTRQVLLEKLWDVDGNFVDEHALTSVISRIRGKIEQDGNQYIKTVYGMGYMWIGGVKIER